MPTIPACGRYEAGAARVPQVLSIGRLCDETAYATIENCDVSLAMLGDIEVINLSMLFISVGLVPMHQQLEI